MPGVRIAPAISSGTCLMTRSGNSGAKGVKTRIITVGRVGISFTSFEGSVTSVPYSFHSRMARVQLRPGVALLVLPLSGRREVEDPLSCQDRRAEGCGE